MINQKKIGGSSKNLFFTAPSKTEFANNSWKSPKIGKLNIDTLIIPQGLLIHERKTYQKSHATVPSLSVAPLGRFPTMAFFAYKFVRAGEELCWNYSYEVPAHNFDSAFFGRSLF